MKILIAGGAGFIGSNFIFYIMENYPDDTIVCLDKLAYPANTELLPVWEKNSRFKFIKADICDREAVYGVFRSERPDIIVNFAAESFVDRSINEPEIFFRTNTVGTAILADACVKFGIERFHQVSTDEVYGELPIDRPEMLFDENCPLRPGNPYSASKAAADLALFSYRNTYGLPVTISRSSNNYGKYQFREKLIPLLVLKAVRNEPLPLYGTGKNIRDWLFAGDHCRAIDLIIRKGKEGEVYNIGGKCEKSNIDIARMVCSVLDKPETLISFVPDRKGHDARYGTDISRISKELGWQPSADISTEMKNTILWYYERYITEKG